MRISRHDLRRRYSNSLVIDAGSQFSLRACSQAMSVANCSEQSAYQNCNIVGQYCNVARKRTSGLTVSVKFSFAAENIRLCPKTGMISFGTRLLARKTCQFVAV